MDGSMSFGKMDRKIKNKKNKKIYRPAESILIG